METQEENNMAEEDTIEVLPKRVFYLHQVRDLALGVHPLSKYIPPLLLLFDALLTSLVIYKVPCRPSCPLFSSTD